MISPAVSRKSGNVEIHLDVEVVKSSVDKVLGEKLYWFPVRHHSPNVALYLKQVLLKRKPKIIFIEGPSQATDLIPYIIHPKTKPPVAIYSSYRDDQNLFKLAGIVSPAEDIAPVFPCWYPMLQYSPEYVAMSVAKDIGAKVFFIDLPHYARLKPFSGHLFEVDDETLLNQDEDESSKDADGKDDDTAEDTGDNTNGDTKTAGGTTGDTASGAEDDAKKDEDEDEKKDFTSEQLMMESQFYQQLAKAAGYRSFDEAWDSLFEMRSFSDAEEFRREFATFCAASRTTASQIRMKSDGTFERERYMLARINSLLLETSIDASEAVVVCGGFHLFADREDKEAVPEIPEGTIYNTVVPYSFFQVSELSGYGAGSRAPHFYQRVWNLSCANRVQDVMVEHVVAVLTEVRRKGQILSSADAIAVSQHAEMLSRLRGRATPVLDDIHDSLVTCCCKGDPAEEGTVLFRAIDAANIGSAIGRVTDELGQLPIVKDFYSQIDDLELNEVLGKEKRLSVELDKREPQGERRSAFLHRLRFLKIPLCGMAEAPSGEFATGMIFREKWHLKWSPQVDSELIELNLYGDSIEGAALSKLRENLNKDQLHAGATSRHLIRAVDMDLPNMIRFTEDTLANAIDGDTRFVSLTEALTNLMMLDRYLVYRSLRKGILDDLIVRCFDKACFAILDVVNVPEQMQDEVIAALVALAEVMQQGDKQGLDRKLFVEHVRDASHTSNVSYLKGAFFGILVELREVDPNELAEMIRALSKAPVDVMVTAGDLLDGVMAVSRTSIMLGADELINAIDELLRAAEWEPFLVMLPKMRAAFERMHEGHLDSLAGRVAELYGLKEAAMLTELHISTAAAVTVARIDQQVAELMKEWNL